MTRGERLVETRRRGPAAWARRCLLAGLAVIAGGVSVAQTVAFATVRNDPQRAHALTPGDGRITAALADRRLTDNQGGTPETVSLAKQALRQDATAVSAVVVLGLNAQVRGDGARARRLFDYAQTLSRRNVKAHLWAIENAVERGDVRGAMRHYDVALRVSRPMTDLLFPVLAAAITNPDVLREVNRTLAGRPSWGPLFIEYTASNGPDPRAAAQVLRAASRQGMPVSGIARALMTEKLVSQGMAREAWQFYTSFRGGARNDTARDPDFSANLDAPTVFDWQSVAANGLVASVEPGSITFSAPTAASGALVQQVQMLPAGTYRLHGQSSGIEQTAEALPYWQLICRDGGREFGRVDMPASNNAQGRFGGSVVVPPDCPVQILRLAARPSSAIGGVSGEIRSVHVEPVQSSKGGRR